jgi:hypothetical protein
MEIINIDEGERNSDWIKRNRRMNVAGSSKNKAVRLALMALAKLNGAPLTVAEYLERFAVDRSQFTRDQADVDKVIVELQILWRSDSLTAYRQAQLTYASSDRTVFRCSSCGAEWWEAYTETLRLAQYQATPDQDGNHFPVVGTFDVQGRNEWHMPTCPLAKTTAKR